MSIVSIAIAAAVLAATQEPSSETEMRAAGVRLVYELELRDAQERDPFDELRERAASIVLARLDYVARVEPEGARGLRVEIPWYALPETGTLAAALPQGATSLTLVPKGVDAFPEEGGSICIEEEFLRYARREDARLVGLERAVGGTPSVAHEAGAAVRLADLVTQRKRIESVGELEFLIGMDADDFAALDTTEERERSALEQWLVDHPEATGIAGFHALSKASGGPTPGVRWVVTSGDSASTTRTYHAVSAPPRRSLRFGTDDLGQIVEGQDALGWPALRFELRAGRKEAFAEWTGSHVNDRLAAVLDGEIITIANIKSRLPGGGIIEGGEHGFEKKRLAEMVAILGSGELPLRPVLVSMRPIAPR